MQTIKNRLDLLQSKLTRLIQKMEEQESILNEVKSENNKLKTSLKEKEELLVQWQSKVNNVKDSSQIEENQEMIKAEIEKNIEELDNCITLIKAM